MKLCFKCGSERSIGKFNNSEFCSFCIGNETKTKNGSFGRNKGYKHTEESKKKMSESAKGKIISEETRRKMSESLKGKKYGPYSEERRKKTSESLKGRTGTWIGRKHSEESKLKISESNKGKIAWNKDIPCSEETKRKSSESQKGEKSHRWKGGIANLPYDIKFTNELKEYIRNRDGNRCVKCDKRYNKRKLSVHHINYQKSESHELNLCALCIGCNSIVNINRKYWMKYFQEYIKKLYKNVA